MMMRGKWAYFARVHYIIQLPKFFNINRPSVGSCYDWYFHRLVSPFPTQVLASKLLDKHNTDEPRDQLPAPSPVYPLNSGDAREPYADKAEPASAPLQHPSDNVLKKVDCRSARRRSEFPRRSCNEVNDAEICDGSAVDESKEARDKVVPDEGGGDIQDDSKECCSDSGEEVRIVAVDLQEMAPIEGVKQIQVMERSKS